jgi:hypothetical protein
MLQNEPALDGTYKEDEDCPLALHITHGNITHGSLFSYREMRLK